VLENDRTDFFVLDENEQLLGSMQLRDLTRTLMERESLLHVVVAGDLMVPHLAALCEDDDLDVAMRTFSSGLFEELPIVAVENPRRLVGSVHKRDLIHAYNQEVMRRDLAGQVSSTVLLASRGQQVDLGGGFVLQEIQPPPRFFGRTIRDIDIARAFGAQVVLLRKRAAADGGPSIRVPTADDTIEEGDRLVVAGTRAAVESLDVLSG